MCCKVFVYVVYEFRIGEELWPVVLFVVAESPKILFKFLVNSFGFPIGFWVIHGT